MLAKTDLVTVVYFNWKFSYGVVVLFKSMHLVLVATIMLYIYLLCFCVSSATLGLLYYVLIIWYYYKENFMIYWVYS